MTEPSEDKHNNNSANINTSSSWPLPTVMREFIDTSGLGLHAILHPSETYKTYAPTFNQWTGGLIGKTISPTEKYSPDLSGKVIFVTGGNGGLGKETIVQLAKYKPARIYLASRSEEKAQEAIASINSELNSPVDIRAVKLDLTSFKSIQAAAESFTSECDRLDTLVLNAGIMAAPLEFTEAGHEIQFGTNHIGHFLLVKLLLPTLLRTAASTSSPTPDVRVVTLTSVAHQMAPPLSTMLSTSALSQQSTWKRYGASKAANILFAAELARRHSEIMSVSLHPGTIATDLYRSLVGGGNTMMQYAYTVFQSTFLQNVQIGARNQVWASIADREHLVNGAYYVPVGERIEKNYSSDAKMGRELWEWTEKEIEVKAEG
ncbi:hypothetical protein FQN54_008792 [Arachnomyces sp. PD_36]|nr:hypothetical protein FQN54_008792 [Arachnomyces sp. PD_36]